MWIQWTVLGLVMGACVIELLDLGSAAERTAARNAARGGSGWRTVFGVRQYAIRPTSARGVRLAALFVLAFCVLLLVV